MFDRVPDLKTKPCPIEDGKFQFLTPEERQIGKIAQDVREWVMQGFDILDFSYPKGLDIGCETAKEILTRAGLLRTEKLDS